MSSVIGVIGGSGLYALDDSNAVESESIITPYADEPVTLYKSKIASHETVFLARHGSNHGIPPHRINYRANLHAMATRGVDAIIAVNVVGGISEQMSPGTIVIPDQIIDYTWGREHTFFDILDKPENHIDFTWPYDMALAKLLAANALAMALPVKLGDVKGIYGCTQGPRLESAAEIKRMKNDGCDIVGMTAMPEAALARELDIAYASIALVVNWAAGLTQEAISFADISSVLDKGMIDIKKVLLETIAEL